ncbi:MAG: hypothetical protein LUD47_00395 [Clostridia bacterium]|nr:hypothetical protein [Clostridia bacterium]
MFKGESAVTEDELVKMKTPNVDIFYTETKEILFALDTRCVQCKKMKWKIEVES